MAKVSKRSFGLLALAVVALVAGVITAPAVQADNSPTVCAIGCPFTTLQTAIAAAVPNSTIRVGAGTYTEVGQIVISKNLTIVGAERSATILKSAQDTSAAYKDDSSAWILVNSGVNFNLSRVTLDGTGRLISNAIISHGSGTINENAIKNIGYYPSGPNYSGAGIALYGSTAKVSNNTLSGIGREGIFVAFSSVATITGNTYIGKGDGNWLDYGIEVGRNSSATISDNKISGNTGVATVDGSTSAGILITNYYVTAGLPSTSATLTKNTVTGNTLGIAVGYDANDTSVVTAHKNNISGNVDSLISTNALVDATNNWWGSAAGPGTLVNVTTIPWCTNISCEKKSSEGDSEESSHSGDKSSSEHSKPIHVASVEK